MPPSITEICQATVPSPCTHECANRDPTQARHRRANRPQRLLLFLGFWNATRTDVLSDCRRWMLQRYPAVFAWRKALEFSLERTLCHPVRSYQGRRQSEKDGIEQACGAASPMSRRHGNSRKYSSIHVMLTTCYLNSNSPLHDSNTATSNGTREMRGRIRRIQ